MRKCTPMFRTKLARQTPRVRPQCEEMEGRVLLSYADGNGPVVTAINETAVSNELIITFDGPLAVGPAQDVANYQVTRALSNPELVNSSGANVKILSCRFKSLLRR